MTKRWKMATGAILGVALLAGTGAAVVAAGDQGPGGPGGMMGRRGGPGGIVPGLRGLDLTDAQREQVKATMDAHKATFDAQRDKLVAAHKALNEAVTAGTFDEATVRQKAADLAAVEADGAVLRAKVHSEVWALLTPEQQTKAKALLTERAERAGQMRERFEARRDQRGRRGERTPRPQGD
ncbi:MAG: Spy/CpxP family protein refolding chaperone [Acidobacteria bacterium]|nr:Spy/CpxP family protein refolding chaperone [Acidobacteriota bacterium]